MAFPLPPVCSTSYSSACLQRCANAPRQSRGSLQVCAADAFCKDKVNVTKKVSVEGSATVTFLGAGGQSISVQCPKVSLPRSTVSQRVPLCSSSVKQQTLERGLCCSPPDTHCHTAQDTYILDAGLDAGVELPYTCRGGICGCGAPYFSVWLLLLPARHLQ